MRSLIALGALSLAALSAACTVHGYAQTGPAEPVGTTYVTSAPVNYESYPHAMYQGRTVYYVNNQWGYPDNGGRFVYYHNEPAELVRYRQHVNEAPPAHPEPNRYEERREGAPPPEAAPPAERVR